MPADPLLTVALPTFDGARHLPDALGGILAQEGPPFELIVCDDRSDDETTEIIRRLAGDRARVEVNSERLGLAGNWNRCVSAARAPFVAVFHQDDVMRPGHIRSSAEALGRHPDVGFVCGASGVIDASGAPVPASAVERPVVRPEDQLFAPGAFVAELSASNPVRCSTVILSKAAHEAVGGFDPSYRYVVDWECWLRLARTHAVAWRADPTVLVRWHPASETHRFKTSTDDLDETGRLLDLIAATDRPFREVRRRADRRLARAYLNRAYEAARAHDSPLLRRALRRAIRLDRGIAARVLLDPRLAARLAIGLAGR